MMDMLEYITNLLQNTNLDTFFVFKPDGYPSDNYLTFNFKIYSDWYSNDSNEFIKYFVTINHLTKTQSDIFPAEMQLREIIKNDKYAYGLVNQGSTYIKDTKEYFSALTFYMLVPEVISE